MDMSAVLIVNIALGLIAFASIVVLAVWAVRTGEAELPGHGGPPGRPGMGIDAASLPAF